MTSTTTSHNKSRNESRGISGSLYLNIWSVDHWVKILGSSYSSSYNSVEEVLNGFRYSGPLYERPVLPVHHTRNALHHPSGGASYERVSDTFYYEATGSYGWFNNSSSASWTPSHGSYTSYLEELNRSIAYEIAGTEPFKQNILLDILEIGDLKNLVTQVRDVAQTIWNFTRSKKAYTISDLLSDSINGDLAYKFAIAPLAESIAQLWNWQEAVLQRAIVLSQYNGKYRKVSRQREQSVDWSSKAWVEPGLAEERLMIVTESVGCIAKANYSSDFAAMLQIAMGMFGFANPFTTLYQHYPMSFVVDWCIGLGNNIQKQEDLFMEYLGLRDLATEVRVKNACYSVKKNTVHRATMKNSGHIGHLASRSARLVSYDRFQGFPAGASGVWLGSGFNTGKIITVGELLWQRAT